MLRLAQLKVKGVIYEKKCMCSAAVRAEDTLYSDNDEFRAVRYTDSSGIATIKDKGTGFTERTWKRRNT